MLITVVGGGMPTNSADAGRPFNTAVVFGPDGRLAAHYHKVHLFDVALADGVGGGAVGAVHHADGPAVDERRNDARIEPDGRQCQQSYDGDDAHMSSYLGPLRRFGELNREVLHLEPAEVGAPEDLEADPLERGGHVGGVVGRVRQDGHAAGAVGAVADHERHLPAVGRGILPR